MFQNFFWVGFWNHEIFWLVIIGLIVWLIVRGSNRPYTNHNMHREKENPLNIIKLRYAKGEITKEEYETLKKDLES
jgi:putative membrane protein